MEVDIDKEEEEEKEGGEGEGKGPESPAIDAAGSKADSEEADDKSDGKID